MPIPKWRGWLMTKLGARGSTSISVGSHIDADGNRNVSLHVCDGWTRSGVRLSPQGARRLARQMIEWADVAEEHNANNKEKFQWRWFVKMAEDGAKNFAAKEEAKATDAAPIEAQVNEAHGNEPEQAEAVKPIVPKEKV